MATTLTIASHVEAFDGSRYKRSLSSSSTPSVPAKRLSRPTSELTAPAQFPATTARPDQRVNVRIPVTRACYSRLLPGQVAFVNRHHGKWHPGPMPSGGLTPVASMEELNDMLSIERNHMVLGVGALPRQAMFKLVNARDMYFPTVVSGRLVKRRLPYRVFDGSSLPDTHPIHQFALDGLVATRVEEVDDLNTYSSASAQQVCTVAVKGHAPMRLAHVPGEVGTGVRDAHQRAQNPADNVYLQPVRILAKVYVVLVATLVDATNQKWKLQYEVVSSSNLDVNALFATGHKLFRSKLNYDPDTAVKGDRLVLRVMELGSVVDTRFGPADQPQLTVCVHVAPYEPTRIMQKTLPDESDLSKTVKGNLRVPLQVFRAFRVSTAQKSQKAASVRLPPSSGLRRMQSGARPATGAGAAELLALKQTISDMNATIQQLAKQVAASEQQTRDGFKDVEEKIDKVAASEKATRDSSRTATRDLIGDLRENIQQQRKETRGGIQDVEKKIDSSRTSTRDLIRAIRENIQQQLKETRGGFKDVKDKIDSSRTSTRDLIRAIRENLQQQLKETRGGIQDVEKKIDSSRTSTRDLIRALRENLQQELTLNKDASEAVLRRLEDFIQKLALSERDLADIKTNKIIFEFIWRLIRGETVTPSSELEEQLLLFAHEFVLEYNFTPILDDEDDEDDEDDAGYDQQGVANRAYERLPETLPDPPAAPPGGANGAAMSGDV